MDTLTQTIDTAIQAKDYATLAAVFSEFNSGQNSWQTVGQGEQRSLAAHFISKTVSTDGFLQQALQQQPVMHDVFVRALSHLPATVPGAADNTLRQALFDYMIHSDDDPDYSHAARILSGMRMTEEGVYQMSAASKTNVHVQIAECFLQEDEVAESDAAVTRAGLAVKCIPQSEMANHIPLILRYKSVCARVLDANRKFLQAAQRYHELSQSSTELIDADDLLALLGRASTCAILAPSGPQRARVLGHIYQDERLEQLKAVPGLETHATILKKMHLHQILQPHEMKQFESTLADHQKAVMGDGLTIMERGVVEHNMIAVSLLYESIYLSELALILGVTPLRAEKLATSMMMDGSLPGATIDQVEGLLEFEPAASAQESWDKSITNFCLDLNRVTDAIKASATTTTVQK